MIYNQLIKKENGVNPFLTSMNFKITFKTWLKQARLIMRRQAVNMLNSLGDNNITEKHRAMLQEEDQPNMIAVEIEYEDSIYYTSEEDSENEAQKSSKDKKGENESQRNKLR